MVILANPRNNSKFITFGIENRCLFAFKAIFETIASLGNRLK